jgi:hypothetical protein
LTRNYFQWNRKTATAGVAELDNLPIRAISPDELDAGMSSCGKQFSTGTEVIFLKPMDEAEQLLPILEVEYDFRERIPVLRLRLRFMKISTQETCVVGLRFETPEGSGSHNYFHAQLISGRPEDNGEWIPETQPCLPLYAEDEIALLVSMVASLYGRSEAKAMIGEFGKIIDANIKDLPWIEPDPRQKVQYETDNKTGRWRRER